MLPPLHSIRKSHNDHKGAKGLLVYKESNQTAAGKSSDYCQWKGCSRLTNADSSNEDYSFETLAKHSDEWQDEHGVLLAKVCDSRTKAGVLLHAIFSLERLCQLYTPFVLKLGYTEQSSAHD